jgi:tetratricopeptide (TPR) repeat protein
MKTRSLVMASTVALPLLSCPGLLRARAGEHSWAGERVLQRHPDVKFIDHLPDGSEYLVKIPEAVVTVLREKDGRLRVNCAGTQAWVQKADMMLVRNALSHFTDRLRANPNDPWTRNQRGIVWSERGELDNAIEDFDEVVRLDPKYESAFYNRGNARTKKKDYEKAIHDYDEAIRLDPMFVAAFHNRGRAYFFKKDYDKAIRDYDEALRLDPRNPLAFSNRGNAWSARMDYAKAIRDYDQAIRLDPKLAFTFYNRASAWYFKADYEKAIRDYDEAIRLDPKNSLPHFMRSVCLKLLRRPAATAGFQTVIDLEGRTGQYATYASILGHLDARLHGDNSNAVRFLKEATGQPDEAWPYAVVRCLRGEIDEPALLKLANDDDKQTEARCFVGIDHATRGHKDEARAHLLWVKEHGNRNSTEYRIALAELARLEQEGSKK